MDLSVIIVNYNVRQFLENALTSIKRAARGREVEIFVVDNASTDGSTEMVKSRFPEVVLIRNPENVGFAKANNQALRSARGRYLLLINPDTVVQEDTLTVMLKVLDAHPEIGLAGCKILNPDGTFQVQCRRSFPTPWVAFTKINGLGALFPRSRLFGKYNLTYLSPDQTYPVDAVSGSFMMVRREAYEAVGGLDEAFFMYGEDLDWCYRIGRSGFKVYYVHETQIVHFKGQSTKRSEIDEIGVFYEAMQLFVRKHFARSRITLGFLSVGIMLRGAIASILRSGIPLLFALLDFVSVDAALFISAYIYLGDMLRFPAHAHPAVWIVPGLFVVVSSFGMGLYSEHRYSLPRAVGSVLLGYIMVSAFVFFAKEFAYSRAVVVISGVISLLLVPGWRLASRLIGRPGRGRPSRGSLFGQRTIIVGTGPSGQEVLRKMRARVDGGYDVVGFIALSSKEIGEKIDGVEVIGSLDNVGKVIGARKIGEVIFSTDGLAYTDILSVIARSDSRAVNFRLVPSSLEAIIGKTRIDELDTMPLVEIEYNVLKPGHRLVKRLFDVAFSLLLMPVLYIPMRILGLFRGRVTDGEWTEKILLLPQVFMGGLSFVGLPVSERKEAADHRAKAAGRGRESFLGPYGLTGLAQINSREGIQEEEAGLYTLYYARNQSLALDAEILMKSLVLLLKRKRK